MSNVLFASRARLALLVFCLALASPVSANRTHTFPGANGQIVFESLRTGSSYYKLFVANADGSGLRPLTTGTGHDRGAHVSPDGTRAVFVRTTSTGGASVETLVVARLDGSGEIAITSDTATKREYAWSPDGTRIVYEDGPGNLWIVGSGGGARVALALAGPGILNERPVFSPDGTRIAFTRLDFTGVGTGSFGSADIFTVRPDGTALTRVTHVIDSSFAGGASFSPDGARIAYTTEELVVEGGEGHFKSVVSVIAVDGTGDTRLSPPSSPLDETVLDWSPSANRLLVVQSDRNSSASTTYTLRPDGTDKIVAYTGTDSRDPVFSPDGTRLLHRFGYDTLAPFGHRTIRLDGSDARLVNDQPDHGAVWGRLAVPVPEVDVVRIEIQDGTRYVLEGPLESGDIDKTRGTFPNSFFVQYIRGTGYVRTPRGSLAQITFNLSNNLLLTTGWRGTVRVYEAGVIDKTFDWAGGSVDYAFGAGQKTWTTTQRICGFISCFDVPVFHSVAFRTDDRI